jgi:hypothetical protein
MSYCRPSRRHDFRDTVHLDGLKFVLSPRLTVLQFEIDPIGPRVSDRIFLLIRDKLKCWPEVDVLQIRVNSSNYFRMCSGQRRIIQFANFCAHTALYISNARTGNFRI